jgi:hypothetical protein
MFCKSMSFAAAALLVVACSSTNSDLSKPAKEMSPDEMMKKMTELGTPGTAHKKLEPTVGKFNLTVHTWMEPGAPEETSTGTETSEWILGGRFVQSKVEGTMMGQPFSGQGITGYDNATKNYQASWIDSMGTMMMPLSTGTVDPGGKVFTFIVDWTCPIQGPLHTREVLTIIDNNRHNFEMFNTGGDGKEHRMMLIEYTRAK